jgi:hypothetical protein
MSFSKEPSLNDGTVIISVYPRYKKFIEEFYDLFKSDVFNDSALNWLSENIKQLILYEGYENKTPPLSYGYIYAQNKTEKLNINKILPSTIKIEPDNNYNNLTYFKFNKLFANEQTCYGTVLDNDLVAYAALNYPPYKKTSSIGVGTIEKERRKGYALSNTIAVAKNFIENGNDASYRCSCKNIASQQIAKSAGFDFIAKKYEIFCEHI